MITTLTETRPYTTLQKKYVLTTLFGMGPAGPGLPPGGTTGQVPAKASDDDYDIAWVDQAGGGGGGTPTEHGHAIADVATLQAALDGKAATTHNHDGAYAALSHGAHVPAPGTDGHVLTLASGAPVWAAPSGGGGGLPEPVIHTLTTLPGHGIVPDIVLADYAALDAYSGSNAWIEVTAGDLGVELWHYEQGELRGPMPPWNKNAPYVLGQNGEDVLIIAINDTSPIDNFHPVNGLRWSEPNKADFNHWQWSVLRMSRTIPVYLSAENLSATQNKRIVNSTSYWALAVGAGYHGGRYRNRPYNGDGKWLEATAIYERSAAEFVLIDGQSMLDQSNYSGFSGLPARYVPGNADGSKFFTTWASTYNGVLEFDHKTYSLRYLTDVDRNMSPKNGDVLTFDQGTQKWMPAAPSGGGGGGGADPEGWVLIETIEWATPLAVVDIALPWATYDEIQIVGPMNVGQNTAIRARVSINGGGAYLETGYAHSYHTYRTWASIAVGSSTGTTFVELFGGESGVANTDNEATHQLNIRMSQARNNNDSLAPHALLIRADNALHSNKLSARAARTVGAFNFFGTAKTTHLRLFTHTGASDMGRGRLRVLGRSL